MVSVSPPTSGDTPAVLLNILAFTDSPQEAQALCESFETRLELPLTALAINQPSNFETIYEQFSSMVVSKRFYADNILTDNTQELVSILSRYLSDAPSSGCPYNDFLAGCDHLSASSIFGTRQVFCIDLRPVGRCKR